ncbi:hypothetical protein THIOKS1340002 [Thiocapsa sp. KS1]|nr:hypothetical protein THIOKS1340002 [Thiocapsa sp. KS1]
MDAAAAVLIPFRTGLKFERQSMSAKYLSAES